MSDSWVFYLVVAPILSVMTYFRIRDLFGPRRAEPLSDCIGLVVCLVVLATYFKATVYEYPEARIGWFAGVLCGAAIGLFDLRATRIRNTPGGMFIYSSRLVIVLFLAAGELWSATHGGERSVSFEDTCKSAAEMFFCTTLFTYAVVFINGIYSGRRFESVNPPRKASERSATTIEYGRRRGRR